MGYVTRMLSLAAKISRVREDERRFYVGAVAERDDGALVAYSNLPTRHGPMRHTHAEYRLTRHLGGARSVYVARTDALGNWALSKPCSKCEQVLRACGVSKVYFTVSDGEYGCLLLQ